MNPLKCALCVSAGDLLGFMVHKKGIKINQNKMKAILDTEPPTTKKQLQSLLGKFNFLRKFISNLRGKTKLFSHLLHLKKEEGFKWEPEHRREFDDIKGYLSNPFVLLPPIQNKTMRLHISTSDLTIGSILVQEDDDDGVERSIYYLSRLLRYAETRYILIEKLCLYL